MHKLAGWVFVICGAFVTTSRAELAGADTIEWLACKADVIAVGQLTAATRSTPAGEWIFDQCVLRVTEVIKGEPTAELAFTHRRGRNEDAPWKRGRVELLVFLCHLRHEPDHDREVPDASASDKIWQHYHLVPATNRHPLSIINLRNPPDDLFDRDGRRLTARHEILKIARQWASSPIEHRLERFATPGSDADQTLYAGSAVLLSVPAEEKFRAELMTAARDGAQFEKAEAARELWKYPGPETEELLRALLRDTSEYQSLGAADDISAIGYPVRAAADQSLRKLGLPVADLPLKREPTPEERSRLREEYWRERFGRALPEGWRVLSVRDEQTRPLVVEQSSGRPVRTRDITAVAVQIEDGAHTRHAFTLFPAEWPAAELPGSGRLGIYARYSSGSRVFYSDGDLPEELRRHLVKQFELGEYR